LIGCETIDGTKSRAHNRKLIQSKDEHLAYIEERTQEYLWIGQNDLQDNNITITKIAERAIKKRISYAELLEEKLKGSGQPQISTTDQDARALLVQG
jgi:hypothetical protein